MTCAFGTLRAGRTTESGRAAGGQAFGKVFRAGGVPESDLCSHAATP